MSSHHTNPRALLNPATRTLIDRVMRAGRPPMHAMTAAQARAFYDIGGPILDLQPAPHVGRVQEVSIPARDGHPMPARLYAPDGDTAWPVLLYLHGGGFTVGSLITHDVLCRQLSRQGHCAVVSLDYRLAPEHRFPTAVHDAWDALNWLHQQGQSLGLDRHRLAVGGDSAGGTLSAVCALMARDAGLKLALQLLFYPGCGARQETASHHTFGDGFMLDKQTIAWFFDGYIDDGDRDDWRFAPGNAPDHSGLAPAWMGLAECDPLVDEGVLYADTLRMAGVPVDLEIYKGVIHGFITMGRAIPDALHAHADAGRALKKHLKVDPMKRQDFRFSHRMRVRWVEVDMQQIVFNGHYLMYFDTAVTDYWRQLAMPYAQTMHQLGGDLYVKKASVEYHASAEMDDFLDVCMRCDRIGNSSMTFAGAIFRGDELLITSELVYVYADPVAKKSQPIPAPLRDMLEGFERGEDMVQVHLGAWQDFQSLASPLRTEVFVLEQKVPAEMEWDHDDETAVHAVALNRMGMPLATGRLLQHAPGVARIGRMAVKKQMRGSDLGHRVLHALMDAARNRGDTQVILHAQCSAEGFYSRSGFEPHGAIFEEAGIAHIEMHRPL